MRLQHLRSLIIGAAGLIFGVSAAVATPDIPPFGIYSGAAFSPNIEVLESNSSVIRLHLLMENLPSNSNPIGLQSPNEGLWGNLNNVSNYPLMPRFTIYLALPATGNPSVTIESWETITFDISSQVVQENDPDDPQVRLGSVGILGGVRVVPVTVKPIYYVNNEDTCLVLSEAEIRIEIDGQPGEFPLEGDRPDFSRPWQQIFRAAVTNWDFIPNIRNSALSHMLVLCPDEYLSSIQSFVNWKEQRGMVVTVLPMSQIGGNPSAIQIRNRIIDEYEDSDPLIDYVLLVGDESKINTSYRFTSDPASRFSTFTYSGSYTDENRYAAIIGADDSDVFPDVFLGRWVINTVSEVLTVVNRTIAHERDVFAMDNTRFTRSAVAADYSEDTQKVTKRHVRNMLLERGFTTVDTLWGPPNPGPQSLINWVNDGVAFVNYRGSGWATLWWGISFNLNSIGQIVNTGRLPIVTGIGCGVGKFDESDNQCFGERWMTQGTVTQPSGAVGFVGPCWNTHTVYNDCLDSSFYKAFLEYDVLNLAPSFVAGKMFTWALFEDFLEESAVRELCETMFRQYLVLSDPSLQVYTQTPFELEVTIPDAIPDGPFELPVTVDNLAEIPADSLLLTVWYETGEFETLWIQQGMESFFVSVDADTNQTLHTTITGDNVAAFYQETEVSPVGPYIAHSAMVLNDEEGGNGNGLVEPGETVQWFEEVWNIGSETATNLMVTLSSLSPIIDVTTSQVNFGTVEGGETVAAASPFVFDVATEIPENRNLDFTLLFMPENGQIRFADVQVPLYAPDMDLAEIIVDDGGNGLLERWESADLLIELNNLGNLEIPAGIAQLSTEDEYLTLVSDSSPVPAIAEDGTFTFPAGALRVHASGITPSAHVAELTLRIESEMDNYTYVRELPFSLTIGAVSSQDPLSDSQQHYWLYDDTDVIYEQAPQYEWIEISPQAGGPGTVLDVESSQQTFPLQIPFSYAFYGDTFDSLSVSTDGWVHPGETFAISYVNQPLPDILDNVDGMIAPMWDDLWYRFPDQETGDLSYYYDVATDRFIVEWYQVHHWQYTNFRETFQIQLLNPETYPAPGGDAEWLILYQEVSELATSIQGCTVGIESPDDGAGAGGVSYLHESEYAAAAAPLDSGRVIRITTIPPAILSADDNRPLPVPTEIVLAQNYPNPFNPETKISFSLPRAMPARLEVYNLLGQRVSTLIDSRLQGGLHLVVWNGQTDSGVQAGSGVYLYRLATPQATLARKMILLK